MVAPRHSRTDILQAARINEGASQTRLAHCLNQAREPTGRLTLCRHNEMLMGALKMTNGKQSLMGSALEQRQVVASSRRAQVELPSPTQGRSH